MQIAHSGLEQFTLYNMSVQLTRVTFIELETAEKRQEESINDGQSINQTLPSS